jgi:hypothetical protein
MFGSIELQMQAKYPNKTYSEILELCYKKLASRLGLSFDELGTDAKTFGKY